MANFINKIRNHVKNGGVLNSLITANIAVFCILLIVRSIFKAFSLGSNIDAGVALPASIKELLIHPWTLLTYMFAHFEFLHILFNMIFLYSFGRLFLVFFTPKNLGSLYFIGGLGGGILFILTYNLIPYFAVINGATLVGASASAMAIIFAVAFYKPNMKVNMFLLGEIKILYIVIGLFILDFIFLSFGSNQGGHISHIGGALVGFIFAKQYPKGRDITKGITNLMDKVANLSKRKKHKSKMKVKHRKTETDHEYNQRKHSETDEIDRILDKIKESGYSSLNKEEKQRLFDASKK